MRKINVGDEFTVRLRVYGEDTCGYVSCVMVEAPGSGEIRINPYCGDDVYKDIKRPQPEPKAGQVWQLQWDSSGISQEALILYADDKSVCIRYPHPKTVIEHTVWRRDIWDAKKDKEYLRG